MYGRIKKSNDALSSHSVIESSEKRWNQTMIAPLAYMEFVCEMTSCLLFEKIEGRIFIALICQADS